MTTAVVVLAGGEGSRMGGGKALRAYGETTLVGHAVELARRWSPLVAVAVREAAQVAGATDAPLILDDPTIEGPMAGLAAAFAFAAGQGAERLLTLPCDTPGLPEDLLERLEGEVGDGVAVAESGGWLHPVCALWRTEAGAGLAAYLESGRRSLRGFAAACGMVAVAWDVEGGDPFAGANTAEELAALQPRAGD